MPTKALGPEKAPTGRDTRAEIAYLTRALKTPSIAEAAERLAERARAENWTHQEYLAACLQRENAARSASGAEIRIKAARFPARKSLEEFDFEHQRSVKREAVAHLAPSTSSPPKTTPSSSARPAPARPTWPSAWGYAPARPDTGSRSPPPPTGSPALPTPTSAAPSRPS
jgi:IstB-like ATP binding protein